MNIVSNSASFRAITVSAALCLSTLVIAGLPGVAHAAPTGPYYHAVLATATAPDSIVSSDVIWQGKGQELTANEAGYRAPMVCAELAQNVGSIANFTAEGVALAADKLEFCNKHARKAK
jgi:hypothetical protein